MLSAVADDSVSDGICEIQVREEIHNAQAVDLMLERLEALLHHEIRKDMLADMAERSMPEVMAHSDGPGHLIVEPHCPADCGGY